LPRFNSAGTYDQRWEEQRAPYLPDDFDERFYQSAPEDQQIPYLQGRERVVLVNLSPQELVMFTLPIIEVPMAVICSNGDHEALSAVMIRCWWASQHRVGSGRE